MTDAQTTILTLSIVLLIFWLFVGLSLFWLWRRVRRVVKTEINGFLNVLSPSRAHSFDILRPIDRLTAEEVAAVRRLIRNGDNRAV